jgi:hypothetical protein
MCNFLSLIVTKDGDVFYDETTDSHEKIISDHKLIDDTNDKYKRQFVRVEITPPDNNVFKPVSEWNFKIDEGETPLWWRAGLEKASRAVCTDYVNKIVFENKDGIEIKSGRAFVKKCSTVKAYGSSTVNAYGSSAVNAYDSSTVNAYDSSTVTACDSSTVKACDSSTVTACGSSTVTAYDSSTVTACGISMVTEIKDDAVVIDRKKEVPVIFVANKKIKIAMDKK